MKTYTIGIQIGEANVIKDGRAFSSIEEVIDESYELNAEFDRHRKETGTTFPISASVWNWPEYHHNGRLGHLVHGIHRAHGETYEEYQNI